MPKGDPDPRISPPTLDEVPALVAEGAARYNAGHYWHAHESWEQAWHGLRAAGKQEEADVLQALVFVTAAFENWTRGKPIGAKRQLDKALRRLRAHPGRCASLGLAEEGAFVAALERVDGEGHPGAPPLVVQGKA
jgi:uncharacterized protein